MTADHAGHLRRPLVRTRRLPLLVLLGALGACLPYVPPTGLRDASRERDAPPEWNEVWTQHVVLRAEATPERARTLAGEAEESLMLVRDAGFAGTEPGQRVEVVVFSRPREFEQLIGRNKAGEFRSPAPIDLDGRPTVYLCDCAPVPTRAVLRHELTHYLVSEAYGAVPRWLGEGLAQYYSSITTSRGRATVGLPLAERGEGTITSFDVERGETRALVPLDALPRPSRFAVGVEADTSRRRTFAQDNAFYVASHRFVHLLRLGPPDYRARFDRYLDQLRHGRRNRDAWTLAFEGVDRAALDRAFEEHGDGDTVEVPFEFTEVKYIAARPLERRDRRHDGPRLHLGAGVFRPSAAR